MHSSTGTLLMGHLGFTHHQQAGSVYLIDQLGVEDISQDSIEKSINRLGARELVIGGAAAGC